MNKQTVTIPLKEYKELLLKDKPTPTTELVGRIVDIITDNLEYTDSTWGTKIDGLEPQDSSKAIIEMLTAIKYIEFELYMEIWNNVMTNQRNKDALKARMEQMRQAKELRTEQDE